MTEPELVKEENEEVSHSIPIEEKPKAELPEKEIRTEENSKDTEEIGAGTEQEELKDGGSKDSKSARD